MKIIISKPLVAKPNFPEGKHNAVITGISEGTSAGKGSPFFSVKFENSLYISEKKFYYQSGDNAIRFIQKLYEACGLSINLNVKGDIILETDDLLNKTVEIYMKIRPWQDTSIYDIFNFAKSDDEVFLYEYDTAPDIYEPPF